MKKDVLALFVKYPQAGSVKTRLARVIGFESAAKLYRLFVESLIKNTAAAEFETVIFFDPPGAQERMRSWLGRDAALHPQAGSDLGQRLENAFRVSFSQGARKVIIIGTDSPQVDNETILEGFRRLDEFPCVIGPSFDGGYYLVGFRGYVPQEFFSGIPWSTGDVFERTMRTAQRSGLAVSLLDPEADVDTHEDLYALHKRLAAAESGSAADGLKKYIGQLTGDPARQSQGYNQKE